MVNKNLLNNLKNSLTEHNNYRYRKLISPKKRPVRLLGFNGTHFLLKFLERSFDLLSDAIQAHKNNRTLLFYLITRAHFETTASICYFLKHLRKFYNNEIDLKEMDERLAKLTTDGDLLGRAGSKKNIFRSSYDFISEFCHPNFFGAAYKTKANLKEANIIFLNDVESFK